MKKARLTTEPTASFYWRRASSSLTGCVAELRRCLSFLSGSSPLGILLGESLPVVFDVPCRINKKQDHVYNKADHTNFHHQVEDEGVAGKGPTENTSNQEPTPDEQQQALGYPDPCRSVVDSRGCHVCSFNICRDGLAMVRKPKPIPKSRQRQ